MCIRDSVCVQFDENRRRNATVRVSTDGQTHTRTDRRTDAKRFYYLSHAICYSYGADNKHWQSSLQRSQQCRCKGIIQSPITSCSRRNHSLCQASANSILKISGRRREGGGGIAQRGRSLISTVALFSECKRTAVIFKI